MEEIVADFDNIKISAFSKLNRISGNIGNVTIGPLTSVLLHSESPKTNGSRSYRKNSKELKKNTDKETEFPINQVFKEFEIQRKERLQEDINRHYNKFEEFDKSNREDQNDLFCKQQAFIQDMLETENIILQVMNQTHVNTSKQDEKLLKHYQTLIKHRLEYQQQLEKTKEKQRILNENTETIRRYHSEFGGIYQEILVIIKNLTAYDDLKNILIDTSKQLKMLSESFEQIISQCKKHILHEEHMEKALNVLTQIKSLKKQVEAIKSKVDNDKKIIEKNLAEPSVNKEKTLPAIPASCVDRLNDKKTSLEQYVSVLNMKRYMEVTMFLYEYTEAIKELVENLQLKQFRFDCKMAVNTPVNAISAVSSEHLRDKYTKLSGLLSGKTTLVADKQINASKYPQGVAFCMDLLARKFVLQGDLMISSNPEAAFCYASIIISLWNEYPEFGKLLLGYFYKQCPYLVPFYIPKTEDQTNEDYYVSLGYHYVDGKIEKQDKFLKRMTGIFRLYFAIFITKPKRGQNENPHDIKYAWNFIASILKLDPQLDITATAIHTFLETVGHEMEAVYGIAFKKLVRIISEKFMPVLKKTDSGGPVSRLEVLLQEYKSKGEFEKPNGILPVNFW